MSQFDYVTTRREDIKEIPKKSQPTIRKIMKYYTRLNVWVFKLTKGRLWKKFPGGYAICVVGVDSHPLWYYNIKANPNVEITVAGKTRQMTARQVSDEQKCELWPHLLSLYPDFDEYQARTDRDIPVFICE
jgi:F420H(2)-dependent quinone reductase